MSLFELGLVLLAAGLLISFIASVMMLVAAFSQHVGWGLGILFFPPVSLLFLFMCWQRARKPFMWSVAGSLLLAAGMVTGLNAHPAGLTGSWHEAVVPWSRLRLEEPAPEEEDKPIEEPGQELIGLGIQQVIERHGSPRVRLESGDTIFLRYDDWEIEADKEKGIVFRADPLD